MSDSVTKRTPAARQVRPQLLVVVELSVVDERQAVLGERLVGGGAQVDDRQPQVAQVHRDPVVFMTPVPSRRARDARSGRS